MSAITSANRKLKIIVASLVVVAIVLAGAVIGVLAASYHTYAAEFSISYDIGDEISAKVKVYYQIGEGEPVIVQGHNTNTNEKYTIDGEGYTIFNAGDEEEILPPGQEKPSEPYYDITLNPSNPTITFYFHVVGIGEYSKDYDEYSGLKIAGSLTGNVSDKFNSRYAIKDGAEFTSLSGEWSDWSEGVGGANQTHSDCTEFYLKVELSVKELNSSFVADGINASFNLNLSKV